MTRSILKVSAIALLAALFTGCAHQPTAVDYTAFKQSHPRSILILPPVNDTTDVDATNGMLAQMTMPLGEAGYYVFPVALVAETFRQNGLANPNEMHQVPIAKLREIFGADAALYVTVKNYGANYTVLNSVIVVTASAKLIDLKTGATLWTGVASANNNANNGGGGGLVGALVAAVVKQVLNSNDNASYRVAGVTSQVLLSAGHTNSVLYGPYSPKFGTD